MGHRLLVSLSLVLVVAGVYGTPVPHGGVPSVGSEWGPVRIHVGYLRTIDGQHLYIYSNTDVIHHDISDSQIFDDSSKMEEYMRSKISDDTVLLKVDPEEMEEKYVEVLSSKVISPDSIKLVCHSYQVDTPFCHRVAGESEKTKVIYSMVRNTDDGTVRPVIFFSHQACDKNDNCFWVTHINQLVVLDKSVA